MFGFIKSIKLNIFIILLFIYGYGYGIVDIVRISDNEFVSYMVNDKAEVIIYKVKGIKLTKSWKYFVKFTDNINLVENKMAPNGKYFKSLKYVLIGYDLNNFYFNNSNNLLIYHIGSSKIKYKIIRFPEIIHGFMVVDNFYLFYTDMILFNKVKKKCEDKHFIVYDKNFNIIRCFGKGFNLLESPVFPIIFVSKEKGLGIIYYVEKNKLKIYDLNTGKLIKEFIIKRDLKILNQKPIGKLEKIFYIGENLYLLKILRNKVIVFKMKKFRWDILYKINGIYKKAILLEKFIILLNEGDKIEIKKINL